MFWTHRSNIGGGEGACEKSGNDDGRQFAAASDDIVYHINDNSTKPLIWIFSGPQSSLIF